MQSAVSECHFIGHDIYHNLMTLCNFVVYGVNLAVAYLSL